MPACWAFSAREAGKEVDHKGPLQKTLSSWVLGFVDPVDLIYEAEVEQWRGSPEGLPDLRCVLTQPSQLQ